MTIGRHNGIAERVEICNALDGLSGAFRFMGGGIFAMTTVTAQLPEIVQKVKEAFEDDTKRG